jgi:hypothetical protein
MDCFYLFPIISELVLCRERRVFSCSLKRNSSSCTPPQLLSAAVRVGESQLSPTPQHPVAA